MNKRAIAILGAIFLLILATVGFLIYQQTKNNNPDSQVTPEQTDQESQGSNSPASKNKAIRLTDDQVVSPALYYKGNGISYFTRQGQLFKNDLQIADNTTLLANKTEVGLPIKTGIISVIWPQTGDNYIAQVSSGGKSGFSIYHYNSGGYIDLPANVTSIDWLPSGEQIIYLWLENNKTTLNIANADNTNYQVLADIWENDDSIHISPDGRNLLFYRTQNSDSVNMINLVSTDGKTFRSIVKDGYNIGVNWAPDSRRFLFGKRDPVTQTVQLWMGNIETGELKSLGLNTIPEKAVWSKDGSKIIVAAPASNSESGGFTEDLVYSVTSLNGEKTSFEPGISVDIENLFLSINEDILFFRNVQDGGLYYMNIE